MILPLPSSPHWAPTKMVFGITRKLTSFVFGDKWLKTNCSRPIVALQLRNQTILDETIVAIIGRRLNLQQGAEKIVDLDIVEQRNESSMSIEQNESDNVTDEARNQLSTSYFPQGNKEFRVQGIL